MKKISQLRREKRRSFGFVTDPLNSFNREAEATLFLMREISSRGHKIFAFEPQDIFLKQNEVWANAKEIEITLENAGPVSGGAHTPARFCSGGIDPPPPPAFYHVIRQHPLNLAKLDCLFLRKDPPFDLNYLFHLWILSKLEGKILMVNKPSAILKHNEKLSALDFPFAPKTWVGSNKDGLMAWAKQFRHGIVIKPLNSSGGRGVYWIKRMENRKRRTESRKPKAENGEPMIAQEFLPEVQNGDKRILLWNGKILGAFRRQPTKKGEFRANLHLGARFVECTLTPRQKKIAQTLARWTKKEGLYFTGLDVIGDHLIEVNVTSTMGIRELNALYGLKVEKEIIDSLCL